MTAKKPAKTGARTSKKLGLNKATLRNLTSKGDKADAVRGGAARMTRADDDDACTGSFRQTCGC